MCVDVCPAEWGDPYGYPVPSQHCTNACPADRPYLASLTGWSSPQCVKSTECPLGTYADSNDGPPNFTLECKACEVAHCARCCAAADNVCAFTGPCTACLTGYYLDQATSTCSACGGNCAICTDPTKCHKCAPGFYQATALGSCIACTAGCATCFDATTCRKCSPGYYLTPSGTCVVNAAQCPATLLYGDFKSASCVFACPPGYYPDASKVCTPCPEGCSSCELDGTEVKCTACISSYNLDTSGTYPICCPMSCKTCSRTNGEIVCSTCKDGFWNPSFKCRRSCVGIGPLASQVTGCGGYCFEGSSGALQSGCTGSTWYTRIQDICSEGNAVTDLRCVKCLTGQEVRDTKHAGCDCADHGFGRCQHGGETLALTARHLCKLLQSCDARSPLQVHISNTQYGYMMHLCVDTATQAVVQATGLVIPKADCGADGSQNQYANHYLSNGVTCLKCPGHCSKCSQGAGGAVTCTKCEAGWSRPATQCSLQCAPARDCTLYQWPAAYPTATDPTTGVAMCPHGNEFASLPTCAQCATGLYLVSM